MKARAARRLRAVRGLACAAGLACAGTGAAPALDLPDCGIAYTIEARLDPASREISGRETITWLNRTGRQAAALPLHLYLNAFAHSRTSWMREGRIARFRVEVDDLRRIDPDPWGWIEPRSIRQIVDGGELDVPWRAVQPDDGNPLDRTLAEMTLPAPVPPGGTAVLAIDFEGRFPIPIARTGGRLGFFVIAQWHPKIGVVPARAEPHRAPAGQFHALTEFDADFADYDVRFTVPQGWLFGGTGRRVGDPVPDGSGGSVHHHRQRAVHDAAFVTGRSLADEWRRVTPEGGGPAVDVRWIVPGDARRQIPGLHEALARAMDEMGRRVGPYPYDVLTVATVPHWADAAAGMEYPTFILGWEGDPVWDAWPRRGLRVPAETVIHELVHQYFHTVIATSEQREAMLDEGFTQYWQLELGRRLWGSDASGGTMFHRAVRTEDHDAARVAREAPWVREPMRRAPSWIGRENAWAVQVYHRPALTLETAARLFGRVTLDRVFAAYMARHAFGHPRFVDFLRVARETAGEHLASFLEEGFERATLPDYRVTEIASEPFRPPVGRMMTDEGPVLMEGEQEEAADAGAAAHANPEGPVDGEQEDLLEPEGTGVIQVEISDPGWWRDGTGEEGSVRRERRAVTSQEEDRPDRPQGRFESVARLEGPAWDNLPVDVEFLFEDGVVLREAWDGRSAWRDYRFVRPARLARVRIDPARTIHLDVWPHNNGRLLKEDGRFTRRWSAWFMGVAQWAASAASMWL